MEMMQRSLAGLLIAGVVALLAGCGDDSPPASGAKDASSRSEGSDKAQRYAECMRKNGVPEFPDPVNGRLMLTQGSGLDPSSPQFKSAERACKSLAPAGAQAGSAQSAEQGDRLQKFSACMRKNGVPEFPDPSSQGGGRFQITGVNPDSPEFKSAMQACRKLAPGGSP